MAGKTTESAMDATRTWSGPRWSVTISGAETPGLVLETAAGAVNFGADEATSLAVRRGWIRWGLHQGHQRLVVLRGISNGDAHSLTIAVRKLALSSELAAATAWAERLDAVVAQHLSAGRWIPTETVNALTSMRPAQALGARVGAARCTDVLSESERRAIAAVDAELTA